LDISADHHGYLFAQTLSLVESGQRQLNHWFCEHCLDRVWYRRLCGAPRCQG